MLLSLAFFYPFLDGSKVLSFRDLSLYFYPMRYLMVDMVRSGQLPLWNPYLFCGYPLLGTLQVGLFYPLMLVHYILPFALAFNYYTVLHYFLAALFMYWLARHFSLSRSSSFLSALLFAFSGYMLSVANMNTTLSSAVWAPLILLYYDRLIGEGTPWSRKTILLGILLVVQFLGGEPTVIYLTLLFLAAYGLVEARGSLRTAVGNIFGLALAGAVAAGLAAVQLFPFLETATLSLRATLSDYAFISLKSFHPRELINLVMPFFFGNLLKEGLQMPVLAGDKFQGWIISPYLGFFPLFFAFLSFGRRMGRRAILLWGMVLFSLFLAFGRFTPVYGFFFRSLPGVSLIRYPVKFLFLAAFSLPLLCGLGFEKVLETLAGKKENLRAVVLLLLSFMLAAVAAYLWASANLEGIFLYLRRLIPSFLEPYFMGGLWRMMTFNVLSLRNIVVYLFLGALLFLLAERGLLRRWVFVGLMLALIVFDLVSANAGINVPADARVYSQQTPNLRILRQDGGLFRYFSIPPRMVEFSAMKRTHDENLLLDRDGLSPNWLLPYRLQHLGGRESMEPAGFMRLYWFGVGELTKKHRKFLDMANVKYIFSPEYVRDPALEVVRERKGAELTGYLYLNKAHLPRAYFVKAVRVVSEPAKVIEAMKREDFDPAREVILESPVKYQWRPSLRKEYVKITGYEPNTVCIQTFADEPRILYLSDTYYPGWGAFVDGQKTKIYRADHMFRAVFLEAGEHEVRFVYSPLSFKLGALVSLLSTGLVSFLFFRFKA